MRAYAPRFLRLLLLFAALAIAGCSGDAPTAPDPSASSARAGPPALDVLTWNIYVGARIEDLLLVQDPTQIPLAVAQIFGAVQATDFPERAAAIVDVIEARRPQVVGLNEVMLFRLQSPGDFLIGNPTPATDPVLDYASILEQELASRGLGYAVATRNSTFDIELPMLNLSTFGLDDIRLTESDLVLVRSDVAWSDPADGTFAAALPIDLPGGVTIFKPSGWASVDIRLKDLSYRVLTTHLEPADVAPGVVDPGLAVLQAAQLAELLGVVDASPHPVVMVGDFNSDPDGSTTATYGDVLDAGFVDAWLVGPPRGPGFTANQAADLLNATSQLFHRIDFVFYRDAHVEGTGRFPGAVSAEVVGEEPGDRTPSGLWPSDHAGVSATLRIAPGIGRPR